jgi:hypothetical protein
VSSDTKVAEGEAGHASAGYDYHRNRRSDCRIAKIAVEGGGGGVYEEPGVSPALPGSIQFTGCGWG